MDKSNQTEQNIMNTTNDTEPTWKEWGEKGKTAPKLKEYTELLIKHNDAAIAVFKEAREKLIKQKEERK